MQIQITDTVKHLIIINVLVFFVVHFQLDMQMMVNLFALHSAQSPLFEPWQILSHMFMHADIAHIGFNMFALWMFGEQLESIWGGKKFLIFYLVTGIGAALVYLLVKYIQINQQIEGIPEDMVNLVMTDGAKHIAQGQNYVDGLLGGLNSLINGPMVGASAAISGLLMAFGVLFPNSELMLLFFPVPIKAKYFIPLLIIYEISMEFAEFSWDNIAHMAHVSGMLIGFILIKIWKKDLDTIDYE